MSEIWAFQQPLLKVAVESKMVDFRGLGTFFYFSHLPNIK
jgi:hypothetical protein